MRDLAPHSRLLNGADLVASLMNPSALWYSPAQRPLPPPPPNRNAHSPYQRGTDKLISCSTWPPFHIICGTHFSLFTYAASVQSARGSSGGIINLHGVCKHMWSWMGLRKEACDSADE